MQNNPDYFCVNKHILQREFIMHEMLDTPIIDRLKAIFNNNNDHPLGTIRWVLYLFMNGHDQNSYNTFRAQSDKPLLDLQKKENIGSDLHAQSDKPLSDSQRKENIGTDTKTEMFLGGPLSPNSYKNIMMSDYLAHLEKTEPNYFERLKIECNKDPDAPQDKKIFKAYAEKISDYSIARDYVRGGEGSGRRLYDRLKSDCLTWCSEEYRKRYADENLDNGRLLTITLCQFISQINILANKNQVLSDLLELKVTFNKNAGTPKNSFIAMSDVYTPRRQQCLPSLSLEKNKNDLTSLSAEDQKERIIQAMRIFIPHFLNRDLFYLYKSQISLNFIFINDNAITDAFWEAQEDIESLIAKIINLLLKIKLDSNLRTHDRTNLQNVCQLFTNHKVFFTKNREEFTSIFRNLSPDDFFSSTEIHISLTALNTIKLKVEEFLTQLDKYYNDKAEREQKHTDLLAFKAKIDNHIHFHKNESKQPMPFKQLTSDKFMLLDEFVATLIKLTNTKITPSVLIGDIVADTASTVTPLELTRHLVNICAEYLSIDELKSLLFNRCLVNITLSNFDERFINFCINNLSPEQLTSALQKICSEKIPSETVKSKLVQLLQASLSDEYIKIELKKFCLSENKISETQLEEQLKAHCATGLPKGYYQNNLLKLCENILIEAEKNSVKTRPVTPAIAIPKNNSNGGTSSRSGSRIDVPPIPLPASPKGEHDKMTIQRRMSAADTQGALVKSSPKGESDKKPAARRMSTSNLPETLAPKGQPSPKGQHSPKGHASSQINASAKPEAKQTGSPRTTDSVKTTAADSGNTEKEKSGIGRIISGLSSMFKTSGDKLDQKKKSASSTDLQRVSDSGEDVNPGKIKPVTNILSP